MLKIENIKLSPGTSQAALAAEAARILKVREKDLRHLQVLRRSVDAREGVFMVYTVEVSLPEEAAVLRHTRNRKVSLCPPRPDYHPPAPQKAPQLWAQATGHTARSYDLTLATDSFRGTLYSKVLQIGRAHV